ncbi:hypothetical protein M9H77_35212 [Catharanthus roseus]|uniref:Uncharacterized protein n=1 Tax=Catharanthus roseus TaxID=4058 RepID=A0ACB9ZND3_CATRO|nr:hypothetical protein M9H77_35212 [Catharanthus roseus]
MTGPASYYALYQTNKMAFHILGREKVMRIKWKCAYELFLTKTQNPKKDEKEGGRNLLGSVLRIPACIAPHLVILIDQAASFYAWITSDGNEEHCYIRIWFIRANQIMDGVRLKSHRIDY